MDFNALRAPNERQNISLTDAHVIVQRARDEGQNNVRLYAIAQGFPGPSTRIPEMANQDNSDMGDTVDTSTSLEAINVPPDMPIYLHMKVAGLDDIYGVAEIRNQLTAGAKTVTETLK
jgi:hypothetical protein